MKIFISGLITGDPNYKEKFNKADSNLSSIGCIVLNPSVLPFGMRVQDYMQIGLAMIDCADAIFMLPDWKESRGAIIEHEYASYCRKKIFYSLEEI